MNVILSNNENNYIIIKSLCFKYLENKTTKEQNILLGELFEKSHRYNLNDNCKVEIMIIDQYQNEIIFYPYLSYRKPYWDIMYEKYMKIKKDEKTIVVWNADVKNYINISINEYNLLKEQNKKKKKEYYDSIIVPVELKKIKTDNLYKILKSLRYKGSLEESNNVFIDGKDYKPEVIKKELDSREHIIRKNTKDGSNVNNKTRKVKFKNQK